MIRRPILPSKAGASEAVISSLFQGTRIELVHFGICWLTRTKVRGSPVCSFPWKQSVWKNPDQERTNQNICIYLRILTLRLSRMIDYTCTAKCFAQGDFVRNFSSVKSFPFSFFSRTRSSSEWSGCQLSREELFDAMFCFPRELRPHMTGLAQGRQILRICYIIHLIAK